MREEQGPAPAAVDRLVRRLGPVGGSVLLLPVLVVALPLWAVSALTRWLSRQRGFEPPSLPWQELIQFEPVVGARTRANLDTHGRAEDVFHLTTDAEGWRGQTTLDEADVVVFGDSFAFGHGVDDEDVYAERIPGVKVKPVASDAYSMVHGLLWMRRLAPRLRGKTVVWFVYCGNDLADNLQPNHWGYRMPFLKGNPGESWEILTDHVSQEPWTFRPPPDRVNPARLFAEFSTPSWYTERVFGAADFLIGEAAQLCEEIDARLVVVSVPLTAHVRDTERVRGLSSDPDRVDLGLPDRRLGESCARHDVPFVPLLPHLAPQHYWAHDMHWDASGHGVVADVVADIHRTHGQRSAPGRPTAYGRAAPNHSSS